MYLTAVSWLIYGFFCIDLLNAPFTIANIIGVSIPIVLLIVTIKYLKQIKL